MEQLRIICPLCEKINPPGAVICDECGRDLRSTPLSDFESFVGSGFYGRKDTVLGLYFRIKQKFKISFEILKNISTGRDSRKARRIADFYRKQLEGEHSSASYYLLLLSEDAFFDSFPGIFLTFQVYFTLWHTYLSRMDLPEGQKLERIFDKGMKLISEQYEKTEKMLEDVLSAITRMEKIDAGEVRWKSPPPPSLVWMFMGRRKAN